MGARVVKDSRRTHSGKQLSKDNGEHIETEAAIIEHAWICTRCFAFMLWLLAWHFCETPESGSGGVSDSSDWFWDPSLSTGLTCPDLMSGFVFGLIVSCAMFS